MTMTFLLIVGTILTAAPSAAVPKKPPLRATRAIDGSIIIRLSPREHSTHAHDNWNQVNFSREEMTIEPVPKGHY
jgi:hypothetical protein